MPKADLLTIEGKKAGTVSLPAEIFAAKINPPLMAQAVRVYLANQRSARAKTKTRAEVKRTKAKWFRQKGTGHARHGARSANIFVGGGVAHGPTGQQNFKLKLSQKMRQRALFSALSSKFKNQEIIIVQGLEKIPPKTARMKKIMENLALKTAKKTPLSKILLVMPQPLENVVRAAGNLKNLTLIQANLLNPYAVLAQNKLILMKESIDKVKETYLGEEHGS
jgi:large subunit ribosomal protein L4